MTKTQLESLRSELVYRCQRDEDPAARAVIYSELVAIDRELEALNAPPVTCPCGAVHSIEEWRRLEYVGLQDDFDGGILELRNCQCRSTLAVQVKP